MATEIEHYELAPPKLSGTPSLLIVRAPYYKNIADDLLTGAEHALKQAGAAYDLADVPGALEIPGAIAIAADKFDGFIALGCVIRGETTHYDTVCNDSSRGLTLLGLRGLPIGNGILTVENMNQAEIRADPASQNKGGGAAQAALHLIALRQRFGAAQPRKPSFGPDDEHIIVADNS